MIRISKRTELPSYIQWLIRAGSILVSLLIISLFLAIIGHNPLKVFNAMLAGCFGTFFRFRKTVELMIPLSITSLGILIAFKMKFWNIGAEGQILMGAFAATFFVLNFSYLPRPILLLIMASAGIIVGGLWALIPAFFKVKFETNETLFTLMLNYIAIKFIIYLQYGPWKDPKQAGFPKIPDFSLNASLPKVAGIHFGWIIFIVIFVVAYFFINKSKFGYEVDVIGESKNTAKYAGMNVNKVVLSSLFLSGALGGLVGMIQTSGVHGTLSSSISGGIGYSAIIVTWLAHVRVHLIPVIGLLFAVLTQGAFFIQTAFQIPHSVAEIMQGTILFCALGSEFFINYQIHLRKNKGNKRS